MFRVIGGVVVYGLALYGAVKLFTRSQEKDVIQSGGHQDDQMRSRAATDVAADKNATSTPDQRSGESTQSASTGAA